MAIINFSLNRNLSNSELRALVASTVKTRTRSTSLARVFQENQAIENSYPAGKVTRGRRSFDDVYSTMTEEEKALYQVWQLEVDDNAIKGQEGGLDGIIATLNKHSSVEFAEINQVYQLSWSPDDPLFPQSYALKRIECEKAWNLSKGTGIKVAVVDSGLNTKHSDIATNIARNDKAEIIGYNFVKKSKDISDELGHGTHVAGIIAAEGNNQREMIGVAPEAKIIPIKAFAGTQGDSIRLANAIKFAVDHGAQVINNSWAYESHTPKDSTLEKAIKYALNRNVICVFAAGNHSEEISNYWIAQHPDLITVASTNQMDQKAPKSNWGPTVTLAAPGHEIFSLMSNANVGTLALSGTSMAAAHVSGAVALYLAHHGSAPPHTVKAKLIASADPISTFFKLGYGRLNCYKLLQ